MKHWKASQSEIILCMNLVENNDAIPERLMGFFSVVVVVLKWKREDSLPVWKTNLLCFWKNNGWR